MDTKIQLIFRSVFFSAIYVFGFAFSVFSCNKQETSLLCETGEATEVTENSVTLSGRAILSPDLSGTVSLGFLLSTQDNPSLDNSREYKTNVIDQYGLFQITITRIIPNTKYYYRAFVKRNDIYVFGAINSFETKNEIRLSVTASAELLYPNGYLVKTPSVFFDGFHQEYLSGDDLEFIFVDITKHVMLDFKTAILYLEIYDDISGKLLRDEQYGVVYNSQTGHYDFALL